MEISITSGQLSSKAMIRTVSVLWLMLAAAGAFAQVPPAVIDEQALFGGEKDIVTVIDEKAASTGVIQLVQDTKTYPVFLLDGTVGAGLQGRYVPFGATAQDHQYLVGGVKISGLSLDFLPVQNVHFQAQTSLLALPSGIASASIDASADLRVSDFERFRASVQFRYDPEGEQYTTPTILLDELFIDTEIGKKVFFRLGKQRISWGVGTWFKPSDVLSLAAIDPDDPTASREGPFAFKADMPIGLNHAMLYLVPPLSGNAGAFSAAGRYDWVVGGWELSFAGFGRTDMQVSPRAMFTFTGAIGSIDVYGEQVLLWGADRTFVKQGDTPGSYATYRLDDRVFLQSTLGFKYSKSTSQGFSLSLNLQGYYNGTGYADARILLNTAARQQLRSDSANYSRDWSQPGMWYLAGQGSVSQRFGEGKTYTVLSLSGYGIASFSDGSMRFNPKVQVQMGDEGGKMSLTASSLTALGPKLSEYAPQGNKITPSLSLSIRDTVSLSASVPMLLQDDCSVRKVSVEFGLYWNAVSF